MYINIESNVFIGPKCAKQCNASVTIFQFVCCQQNQGETHANRNDELHEYKSSSWSFPLGIVGSLRAFNHCSLASCSVQLYHLRPRLQNLKDRSHTEINECKNSKTNCEDYFPQNGRLPLYSCCSPKTPAQEPNLVEVVSVR